jgi:cytochrome c biogenesis protein CcmG/thiol:disulfide interchange protein DsbE
VTDVDGGTELDAAPRRSSIRWISALVALMLVGLVALLATRDTGERAASSELLGRPTPAVTGTDLDGVSYDIADHEGEWVLVNFFSTWCGPCVDEHPQLLAFDAVHSEAGDASIVSVVFDDDEGDVRDFFEREGGEWPVLIEGTEGIAVGFGVTGVPESYLVAPDGTVVAKWISGVTAQEIESAMTGYEPQAAAGETGE